MSWFRGPNFEVVRLRKELDFAVTRANIAINLVCKYEKVINTVSVFTDDKSLSKLLTDLLTYAEIEKAKLNINEKELEEMYGKR